jgi:hypothetical protein
MQRDSISSKSRFFWPRLLSHHTATFTPEEVRQRLRLADTAHPRTAAVHSAASRISLWSSLLPDKIALDLGAAGQRLPTIVFWHCQGISLDDIGRRISPLGGPWDAERAIDVASQLIAHILNEPGFVDDVAA